MDDFYDSDDMDFEDSDFSEYHEEPFDNELEAMAGTDTDNDVDPDQDDDHYDPLYWATLGYGFGYYDGETDRLEKRKRKKSDDEDL